MMLKICFQKFMLVDVIGCENRWRKLQTLQVSNQFRFAAKQQMLDKFLSAVFPKKKKF